MSIPIKTERSLLSHAEFEIVRGTHHPAIYRSDVAALKSLKTQLRDLLGKERTLARQKRREVRGKVEARGKSFPGTAEQPQRRKQVFAGALKRVNREIDRLQKLEVRTAYRGGTQGARDAPGREIQGSTGRGPDGRRRHACKGQSAPALRAAGFQDRQHPAGDRGGAGKARRAAVG